MVVELKHLIQVLYWPWEQNLFLDHVILSEHSGEIRVMLQSKLLGSSNACRGSPVLAREE